MLIIDKMLCAYKMEPLHPPISLVNAFRLYDLGKIFQSFSIATASKWLTTPKPCNYTTLWNTTMQHHGWLYILSRYFMKLSSRHRITYWFSKSKLVPCIFKIKAMSWRQHLAHRCVMTFCCSICIIKVDGVISLNCMTSLVMMLSSLWKEI